MRVSALCSYPVKSCGANPAQRAMLDDRGIVNDRHWMIAGEGDYMFLSQSMYPRMALIQPTVEADHLRLAAPGAEDLLVPLASPETNIVNARVWMDLCEAVDDGAEAADWLSAYMRMRCRLVHMRDGYVRATDPKYSAEPASVGFADAFPILIISEASLDALNEKLETPVPMDRFRPNIVVAGCAPHAEDEWKRIRIGGIEFEIAKPCARCTITTIDQKTAEKKGPEPLKTLAAYRKTDKGVMFGQNAINRGRGEIKVGDAVELIA